MDINIKEIECEVCHRNGGLYQPYSDCAIVCKFCGSRFKIRNGNVKWMKPVNLGKWQKMILWCIDKNGGMKDISDSYRVNDVDYIQTKTDINQNVIVLFPTHHENLKKMIKCGALIQSGREWVISDTYRNQIENFMEMEVETNEN